jgi:hypothetical protein
MKEVPKLTKKLAGKSLPIEASRIITLLLALCIVIRLLVTRG